MGVGVSRPAPSFARDTPSLSLDELVGEARTELGHEMAIPLSVNQPPNLWERDANGQLIPMGVVGAQIGVSMSGPFVRYLGHPADEYGNTFPVSRSLYDLRGWCRGRHLEARTGPWLDHVVDVAAGRDAWSRLSTYRPLCARLAYYTVVHRVPLSRLARQERIPDARAEHLLHRALQHAFEQRREWAQADGPERGDSAINQVLAQQRRERRDRRQRVEAAAEAATAPGMRCRHCHRPYERDAGEVCQGPDAEVFRDLGITLLCSPAVPT
jgi:hypothetical protein